MMRLANAWKVKLSKREARYLPHLRSTRSARFLLASTLNEIARILLGYRHVPVRKRKSARCASISVLPAPGPAVSAKQRLRAFAARFARFQHQSICGLPFFDSNHSGSSVSLAITASASLSSESGMFLSRSASFS